MNPRGPINLITNNFKIKSQTNHSGIIYTYTVDFIDGENMEQLHHSTAAQQQESPTPTETVDASQMPMPASATVTNPEEEEKKEPAAASGSPQPEESKQLTAMQIMQPKSG